MKTPETNQNPGNNLFVAYPTFDVLFSLASQKPAGDVLIKSHGGFDFQGRYWLSKQEIESGEMALALICDAYETLARMKVTQNIAGYNN